MKRATYPVVLTLFVSATVLPVGGIVPAAIGDGGGFSRADIDGDYGFEFSGGVLDVDTFGYAVVLPVSAVGQFNVNKGKDAVLTRTLNIGGGIVQDTFTGEVDYVNPDGTGSATFCTESRTSSIAVFPAFTKETFTFVITGEDDNEVEFIGTQTLPSEQDCSPVAGALPLPVSIQGTARKQDVDDGDDD